MRTSIAANQDLEPSRILSRFLLLGVGLILFSLSKPGSDFPWLTWFCFVPVWFALRGLSPVKSAFLLFSYMLATFALAIWWFSDSLASFTESSLVLAIPILFALCAVLAAPYALAGYFIGRFARLEKLSDSLLSVLIITLVVSVMPSYLPGNHAHSLYQSTSMIQVVDLGGVPALFLLVLLVNFLLAYALFQVNRRWSASLLSLMLIGIVFMISNIYGQYRIGELTDSAVSQDKLKIGIIQPKLEREDSLDSLYSMSEALAERYPDLDLLVWPEIPSRFSYADNRSDRRDVNQLIHKLGVPMVVVSGFNYGPGVDSKDPEASYRNTAHLLDASRRLKASYSKQVLVPFFEYLPFEAELNGMRTLFPGVHRYVPGNQIQLFELNDEVKLIPLICYETIFTDLSREFIEKGGNLFLNLSNDIWLGKSHGAVYHFALGMMRSVEYRTPWVRATNSGVSGVVSASGDIEARSLTKVMSEDARMYEVSPSRSNSFYSTYPSAFLLALAVLIGLLLALKWFKVRR